MNTDRINFIFNKPSEANREDLHLIEKEIQKYPFSQALHILRAKIEFNLNSTSKNEKLTTAAIFTSDRAVLKKVIQEKGYLENRSLVSVYQGLSESKSVVDESKKTDTLHLEVKEDRTSFFDEVLENLKKLKELREQFLFLELEESKPVRKKKNPVVLKKSSQVKEIRKTVKEKKATEDVGTDKSLKQESRKKKREEIVKKDQELDSEVNAFFLKQIEKNEGEKEHQRVKHKEQKKIIEKFIVEQPTIGSIKPEELTPEKATKDLSERSTRFGDDLVSENLAIILLKQGKKERSIDIYKKLIWKLPQKKAYFAARIEEIKK